ncbi:MAG: hypothetical protein J7K94_03905 [Dehalococcoidia bacterium]|nr:hypothetical protein [Dehalococcoidia bacterium]
MYDVIKKEFALTISQNGLETEEVAIRAVPLSPEEAIGNPEERDYPLVTGRERLMQAEFKGSLGQAFTDMYGDFTGKLSDIVAMDLKNNFRRAIFISSLNAVMRYLRLVDKTVHCRDNEPRECSHALVKYLERNYDHPRIAFTGFQPRMVEALSGKFELRVADMDHDNIGREKFGVVIDGPEKAEENLRWCDIALVTGTTIVNDTFRQFEVSRPVIFYGITISGVAQLLGLNHFCHCGH